MRTFALLALVGAVAASYGGESGSGGLGVGVNWPEESGSAEYSSWAPPTAYTLTYYTVYPDESSSEAASQTSTIEVTLTYTSTASPTAPLSTGVLPPYPGGNATAPAGTGTAPYPISGGPTGTAPMGSGTGTASISYTTPVGPIYTGGAAQVGGSLFAAVAAGVIALA